MKKKSITILLLLGLTALIIFKLASNKNIIDKKSKALQKSIPAVPVTAAVATEQNIKNSFIKTGQITADKQAAVLAPAAGNILQLNFALGSRVVKGQILGRVDTRVLQLDYQKSQSAAAKLKADLQTYTELLQGNAATREKVEEIRQNYIEAKNKSAQLNRQIADAAIKAPISGVISEKSMEEGVFATSGAKIALIVNLIRIKVSVSLTESEVYKISEGQTVTLETEVSPAKQWKGVITYISPQADQSHNYNVEITAENTKENPLRSGTFATINFKTGKSQQILLIPRDAILESSRNASVYIIENGKAVLKPIKTGLELNGNISVTEGLKAGQSVIVTGQINLQNGTPVILSK